LNKLKLFFSVQEGLVNRQRAAHGIPKDPPGTLP